MKLHGDDPLDVRPRPSRVRMALDELLRRAPHFDVVSIDWQVGRADRLSTTQYEPYHVGPWVLVELGQPSDAFDDVPAWAVWKYAIWKATGALHVISEGAVVDPPIWEPT